MGICGRAVGLFDQRLLIVQASAIPALEFCCDSAEDPFDIVKQRHYAPMSETQVGFLVENRIVVGYLWSRKFTLFLFCEV